MKVELVLSKCMYECNDKYQTDYKLNPYECAMLNYFELYNVYAESAKIEKWSILRTKGDDVEWKRKGLPTNRVKINPTEGRCQKSIIK